MRPLIIQRFLLSLKDMEHTIEIYSEGTKDLISILLKNARIAINKFKNETGINIEYLDSIFFTNIKQLGLYKKNSNSIALSKRLLETDISMEFVNSIMLHELSHYICDSRVTEKDHGPLFKMTARIIGAPEEFIKATIDINLGKDNTSQLSKIKKLLALSESENINESKNALAKARKLMTEMNIQEIVERKTIFTTVLFQKKSLTARYKINSYLTRDISGVYLIKESKRQGKNFEMRIFGTESQVEIACYVFDYLDYSLNKEYQRLRVEGAFEGRALESFYYGVYNELQKKFCKNSEKSEDSKNSLTIIQDDNENKALDFYFTNSTVIKSRSNGYIKVNKSAFNHGKNVGSKTNIRNGINYQKKEKKLYIK